MPWRPAWASAWACGPCASCGPCEACALYELCEASSQPRWHVWSRVRLQLSRHSRRGPQPEQVPIGAVVSQVPPAARWTGFALRVTALLSLAVEAFRWVENQSARWADKMPPSVRRCPRLVLPDVRPQQGKASTPGRHQCRAARLAGPAAGERDWCIPSRAKPSHDCRDSSATRPAGRPAPH